MQRRERFNARAGEIERHARGDIAKVQSLEDVVNPRQRPRFDIGVNLYMVLPASAEVRAHIGGVAIQRGAPAL